MLDIKLKNNKRKDILIVFCILLVFSLGFISCYPYFEKQAAKYEENPLEGENFLRLLFQNNLILYKNVRERATESKLDYADLYLSMEKRTDENILFSVQESESIEYLAEDDFSYRMEEEKNNLNSAVSDIKDSVYNQLNETMDFCAIDHETGAVYKNTGRTPEKLAKKSDDWTNPYVYYIKFEYDKAGNPYNFVVYGQNADELLKKVQKTAEEEKDCLKEYIDVNQIYMDQDGVCYLFGMRPITDATFIYAMTQDQMNVLLNSDESASNRQLFYDMDIRNMQWRSYYYTNIPQVFGWFLLALMVIAIIAPRIKGYQIADSRYCKAPIEGPIVLALCIVVPFMSDMSVSLANFSNHDHLQNFLAPITGYNISLYNIVKYGLNILVLMCVFGIWYWCVTCFLDLKKLGIRRFFAERSVIVRYWSHIKSFFQQKWENCKAGLLHVDLNQNIEKHIAKAVILNLLFLSAASLLWFFGIAILIIYSVVLFLFLRKYAAKIQKQYRNMLKATESIADGNLNTSMDMDLGVFESYKQSLSKIQEGFRNAVDQEVKSQKLKTELITNVSHDLKTPLTAIITYIELLKEENITEQQRKEYLQTLERKSHRLKILIEDLFEVSKADSRNVTLNVADIDLCNLIRQAYLEYSDRAEETGLDFRFQMPKEKVILKLDSQKTYRIFDNLYTNALKYAMPHSRVYVNVERQESKVHVEMKNISANELNIRPEELTERFVRGDSSRNTEESGLGLAIAQSFVELQGGRLWISIDGDLYKVIIEFPV